MPESPPVFAKSADSGSGAGGARRRKKRITEAPPESEAFAGRVPPQDLQAEKAVLSALLIHPPAFNEVSVEVKAEDFYSPAHQQIYAAMLELHEGEKPVDLISLRDKLRAEKTLAAVGGEAALADLSDFVATAANVGYYAKLVRDKAVKRRLIGVATEIAEAGYEDEMEAQPLLDFAEGRVFEVSTAQSRTDFQSVQSLIHPTFDHIEEILNRGGDITGLSTGFTDLDKLTGGLQKGELIIVAARPSMGKTAFALDIARHAACEYGKKIAVFSLEMTNQSLMLRLLASQAGVDMSSLRNGFLPERDHKRLMLEADKLSRAQIWLDDSGSATIFEIKAKSRRIHARDGLDLVVLDYLQLASGEGQSRNQRKDLEIAEISRGLKALAKELDLPVMALSQLNRGPEQRDPDKRRPMMGDLRESGAIEQDADLIAFIYRDVVYNAETEDPRKAEIIVEKQRNGPTGKVELDFEKRMARFQNRSPRDEEGAEDAVMAQAPDGVYPGPEGGPPGGEYFGNDGSEDEDEETPF